MLDVGKKIWFVLKGQLNDAISNKRIWMGYLIGITTAIKTSYLYCGYAGERAINIFEPCLMNYMTFGDITMMLIGYVLIIADAPFVNCRSMLTIYRTTRKNWCLGMNLYIVMQGLIYYAITTVFSILLAIPRGYISNQWSRPMRNLVLYPSKDVIEVYHMPSPASTLLEKFQPIQAMAHTLLLISIYSFILGILLFALNVGISKAIGTICVGIVHVGGFMMMDSFTMPFLGRWSLLANAEFVQHLEQNTDLFFSYCLMFLVLCCLFYIETILLKYADLKVSIGGWNE